MPNISLAMAPDRLRSRSAYPGPWSRLRFGSLPPALRSNTNDPSARGSSTAVRPNDQREERNNMAAKTYKCSLAGEDIQAIDELIVYEDKAQRINRPSHELRRCSHVAKGGCPVRPAQRGENDVEGWGYSHTRMCEYLSQIK